MIERGEVAEKDDKHVARFKLTRNGVSPRPYLGEEGNLFWSSGAEHSEYGQVSENPQQRKKMMEKRANKLKLALEEIPLEEKLIVYGDEDASLTIISWGSNKGVILDALKHYENTNKSIRTIIVKLLWPFPADEINKLIHDKDTLVVIECNQTGQFNNLLKEQTGRTADHLLLKYTGRPFMLEDILHNIDIIISGKAEKVISVE